jgi:uncharacterized protein YlxW (UPF0749 family)
MPDPDTSAQRTADGRRRRFGLSPDSGLARLFKALRAKPDLGQLGVGVLIAALGFAAVEQVQLEEEDLLESARRSDLIEIFGNLQNQSDRLEEQARELRAARNDLLSNQESEQAALEQARQRQQELGLLAGTVPASGPGIIIRVAAIKSASDLVSAVQELRVAGAEAIQIRAVIGAEVRVGVDTYFVDTGGSAPAVSVDGVELALPLEIKAIGDPPSLEEIGLFLGDDIAADWTITQHDSLDVDAVREPGENQYAQPAPDDD